MRVAQWGVMRELHTFEPLLASPGETFDALTEAECRALLGTQIFGRIGLTRNGLPAILPVHYVFSEGVITFRTGGGGKLRAAENGDVLAFQVDAFDPATNTGWSVLALGRATVLTTEHEHEGLPTFDTGAGGPRNHYVRIHCELFTGRRLVPPTDAPAGT